jgi:hypothetical protein
VKLGSRSSAPAPRREAARLRGARGGGRGGGGGRIEEGAGRGGVAAPARGREGAYGSRRRDDTAADRAASGPAPGGGGGRGRGVHALTLTSQIKHVDSIKIVYYIRFNKKI